MARNNKYDDGDEITFNLVDEDTVTRLQKDGKVNVPAKKVNIPKDKQWNERLLASKLLQGIQNGDSVQKIAKSFAEVITNNAVSAMRNARTMTTSAECHGRLDSYEDLAEQGVVLKKVWIATPDDRTRSSHLEIDGEEVDLDEEFSNGCKFPGDGDGPPEEVWNCRCSIKSHIVGRVLSDGTIKYLDSEPDETIHDKQIEEERERREEKESQGKETENTTPPVDRVTNWGWHEKGGNSDERANELLELAGIDKMDGNITADIRSMDNKDRVKLEDDGKEVILVVNNNTNEVYIDSIFVKEKGQGTGTAVLTEIKEQAEEQGFDKLTAYAAGDFNTILEGHGYNGYYSLARFGFDGEIAPSLKEEAKRLFDAETVQDLMKTEEGRKWWKNNGTGFEAELILKRRNK